MNINQAITLARQKLQNTNIPNPHLEAEILLSHILKKPREYLLTYPKKQLTKSQITNYRLQITKRSNSMPLAYLTGHKEFYGLDFLVNRHTLIPRPETELMVEETLKNASQALGGVGLGDHGPIIERLKLQLAQFRTVSEKDLLLWNYRDLKGGGTELDLLMGVMRKMGICNPVIDKDGKTYYKYTGGGE